MVISRKRFIWIISSVIKKEENKVWLKTKEIFVQIEIGGNDPIQKFDTFIKSQRFSRSEANNCAYYTMFDEGNFIIFILYIDDILVVRANMDTIIYLKGHLARKFKINNLGGTNQILEMNIQREITYRTIQLGENSYIQNIFPFVNIKNVKPFHTPNYLSDSSPYTLRIVFQIMS